MINDTSCDLYLACRLRAFEVFALFTQDDDDDERYEWDVSTRQYKWFDSDVWYSTTYHMLANNLSEVDVACTTISADTAAEQHVGVPKRVNVVRW